MLNELLQIDGGHDGPTEQQERLVAMKPASQQGVKAIVAKHKTHSALRTFVPKLETEI